MFRQFTCSTALAASLACMASGAMSFEVIEQPEAPSSAPAERAPRQVIRPATRVVVPPPAPAPAPVLAPVPVPLSDLGAFDDTPAAPPAVLVAEPAAPVAEPTAEPPSDPIEPPPEMLSHQFILEVAMRVFPEELNTRPMYALWLALGSVDSCASVTRMHELQIAALERSVPEMIGAPRDVIHVHPFPMPVYDDAAGVFTFGQVPRDLVQRIDRVQARLPDTGRGVCSPLRAFRQSVEIATDFVDLPMERRIAHRLLDRIGTRRSVVAVFHISPDDFEFTGHPGRNAGLLVDIRPSRVSIHELPSVIEGHAGDLIATFDPLKKEWTLP